MNVFNAVIPVFILILVGYCCRLRDFPSVGFWQGAQSITYYIFFPALLFVKTASADINIINFPLMVTAIVLILLVTSSLMLFIKSFVPVDSQQFTSIYQGGIRFNAYIGFAISASLFGTKGIVYAAVISAIMIPSVNIFSVAMLEYHRMKNTKAHNQGVIRNLSLSIIQNPLIIACVGGILFNSSGIYLPEMIKTSLTLLSNVALPLGVLTVGAALNLKSFKSSSTAIIFSSSIKFFIMPLCTLAFCYMLNISDIARNILLVISTIPTATSSYILAKQLDGDAPLMATIISIQTLMAAVLIPALLSILL